MPSAKLHKLLKLSTKINKTNSIYQAAENKQDFREMYFSPNSKHETQNIPKHKIIIKSQNNQSCTKLDNIFVTNLG